MRRSNFLLLAHARSTWAKWAGHIALAGALVGVAGAGCALQGAGDEGGVGGAGIFLEQTKSRVTVGDEETPVDTVSAEEVDGVSQECTGVGASIDGWHPALVAGTSKAAIIDASGNIVCVDDADVVTRSVAAEYGVEAAREFVWLVIGNLSTPVEDPTPQPAAMNGLHDPTPQPASSSDGDVEDPTPQPAREIHDPTPQPAGQ